MRRQEWTVGVLAGGLSPEREVSLRSGRRIAAALRAVGHAVEEWDADHALLERLDRARPDAVVIALHGGDGENGAVQGVLDMIGVPYVGTPARACRQAWDKPTAKTELAAAGWSTPDWVVLPHNAFRELGAQPVLDALVNTFGLPLLVKPDQGGSALGTRVVRTVGELPGAAMACLGYGDTVLAERFIEGTEIAVSVIDTADGPVALPAVEIIPSTGVYDYTARYTAGLTDYRTPARLPVDQAKLAGELALAAHHVLGLRDLSRTDAIITADGTPVFLEVNVSPGVTETSLLPLAIAASGRDLGTVFSDLIDAAVARHVSR